MPRYSFPGFPKFLEAAAVELGRPEALAAARRINALAAVANLCAQAANAEDAHVVEILVNAAEYAEPLRVALRAADLMLAEVAAERGLGPSAPEPQKAREKGLRR